MTGIGTTDQLGAEDPAPPGEPSGLSEPAGRSGSSTSARWALIAFVVAVVASGVLILWRLGNQRWFSNDEWDFLSTRHLTDVGDLFRPHNEHWTTLPIVAFRLVWSVNGLRSYWPYQVLSVGAHLSAVVLLRVVMRRAGVRPWFATVAAGSPLTFMLRYTPGSSVQAAMSAMMATSDSRHIAP